MTALATRKAAQRPWDVIRVAESQWDVTLNGQRVQAITDERVARILEAALGIRVLKHATNDVEWRLGREVWRCTDQNGVQDVPAAADRDQMAAALIACGYREVP